MVLIPLCRYALTSGKQHESKESVHTHMDGLHEQFRQRQPSFNHGEGGELKGHTSLRVIRRRSDDGSALALGDEPPPRSAVVTVRRFLPAVVVGKPQQQ